MNDLAGDQLPQMQRGSRRRPTRFGFLRSMQIHLQANWIRTLTGLEGFPERVIWRSGIPESKKQMGVL
jgi:hypothetical protein